MVEFSASRLDPRWVATANPSSSRRLEAHIHRQPVSAWDSLGCGGMKQQRRRGHSPMSDPPTHRSQLLPSFYVRFRVCMCTYTRRDKRERYNNLTAVISYYVSVVFRLGVAWLLY